MDDIALARALHVVAVIHWIGGLAFVTLIVLPLARSRQTAQEAVALFNDIERRFSTQVRISVPLAGASGLWMTYRWNLWDRFADPHFWWMHAMVVVWALFTTLLFVLEPLWLHRWFEASAQSRPERTFAIVQRLHWLLLIATLITVAGAVAGSHGGLL